MPKRIPVVERWSWRNPIGYVERLEEVDAERSKDRPRWTPSLLMARLITLGLGVACAALTFVLSWLGLGLIDSGAWWLPWMSAALVFTFAIWTAASLRADDDPNELT